MSGDTRERARQVAAELVRSPNVFASQTVLRRRITDALVNAARNERLRIADRAETLARPHAHAWARAALEALAAELRAEGGGL